MQRPNAPSRLSPQEFSLRNMLKKNFSNIQETELFYILGKEQLFLQRPGTLIRLYTFFTSKNKKVPMQKIT